MNEPKLQHFVAQSYLERWETPDGSIWTYDKSTDRAFVTGKAVIGAEKWYYSIPKKYRLKDVDPHIVERELAEIDGRSARHIRELIDHARVFNRLVVEHQEQMATFIAIQMARTPEALENLKQMMNAVSTVIFNDLASEVDPESPAYLAKYDDEWLRIQRLTSLLDPRRIELYKNALMHHRCLLYVCRWGNPFYTSDHPIALFDHHPGDTRVFGIGSEGVEILCPLSPSCVISFASNNICPPNLHLGIVHVTHEQVPFFNELQVTRSRRHVFASSDDFLLARSLCETYVHLRDPDRRRGQIVVPNT